MTIILLITFSDEELASFPIDSECLSVFKPIVTLAGRIDKDEHRSVVVTGLEHLIDVSFDN